MNPIKGEGMDLEKLRRRVGLSTLIAFFIFALVVLFYVGKLWLLSGAELSGDTAVWGQFGDYLGGLLNPLIAFLAFYWLTQSVILQKEELTATRDALIDSANSQSRQVDLAKKTAEINALSALLASHDSDISRLHQEKQYLSEQFVNYEKRGGGAIVLLGGRPVLYADAEGVASEIDARIVRLTGVRQDVIRKLDELLQEGGDFEAR